MEFTLFSLTGLFMCLMFFFAGFVDSICGGGGLLTVPAAIAAGIPTGMITGTNQCGTVVGNFIAAGRYMKNGRVDLRAAGAAAPLAIAGAVLGSRLNLLVPETYLQIFMLAMVPILLVIMLVKKEIGSENHAGDLTTRAVVLRSAAVGLVLGCYQGFYGPGGGMLMMLAFAFLLKTDLVSATACTRCVIACSCVAASASYAISGGIIWEMAAACNVFNIFGSYVGAGFAIRHGTKVVRPLMLAVIVLLFVRILVSLL